MKEIMAFLVTLVMLSLYLRFPYQVYKGQISPVLSTWLIILIGVSLSFTTYMAAENMDYQSGILNTVDVVGVFVIVLSIVVWGRKSKALFKPFEKKYLVVAGLISFFWLISSQAFISNLLVQVLISVGYIPTIRNLVREKKNTESFTVWGLVLVAAVLALYPAAIGGNLLAVVYAARTMLAASIVLGLMVVYYQKAKAL